MDKFNIDTEAKPVIKIDDEKNKIWIIRDPEVALEFLYGHVRELVDNNPEEVIALDFETTALNPHNGHVRLSSITAGKYTAVIDHYYAGDFMTMYKHFAAVSEVYYVFNAKFEQLWLDWAAEFAETATTSKNKYVVCHDIAFLRKSVMGGGPLSLKMMVKWDLGIDLSKDEQSSDWSATNLTMSQYTYAAYDAIYTKRLADMWINKMEDNHWQGFFVFNDAVRATMECERTGLHLDEAYHEKLIKMWTRRRDVAERTIRKYASPSDWANLLSKKQLSDYLKRVLPDSLIEEWPKTEKTGQLDTSRYVLSQFSYNLVYPASRFLAAIVVFNRAEKYLGTYGEKLLNCSRLSGAIYARFNMAQAVTGRYSSSGACNLQNLPNNPKVRRSFIPRKDHKFIIADYKGIELRVLAEMSGDEQLRHDVIFGDVHAQSAITIYGFSEKKFLKALGDHENWAVSARRKAKAFSFQLTYGAGPGAVSLILKCSTDDAVEYINRWAERYNRAYNYRRITFEKMMDTGFIECASGRTIYVPARDRSVTIAANYGIQGSAADCMYRAMYHAGKLLDKRGIPAHMVAPVHDELLVEVHKSYFYPRDTQETIEEAMTRGWLDIFPGTNTERLIEIAIGNHWGDKA